MASSINASTSGAGGVITTADATGILNLQTAGTTAVTIDASQNTTFAGKVASAGALTLASNGSTTAVTIDTSQNVGIGTATVARTNINSTNTPVLQIEGITANTSAYAAIRNSNDSNPPRLWFAKSRGTSVGSNTIVQNNDVVGTIAFTGSDGTNFIYTAAIDSIVNGTPGTNDMPGALLFSTTPDGSPSPTERMRIDSSGNLLIGTTNAADNAGAGTKFIATANPVLAQVGAASTNAAATYELYSTGATSYRFYVGFGGTVFATSTVISAISDARFKENIQDLDVGLDAVMSLKPRKFDWKEGKGKDIKGDRGFIAQEFETVFPDLIDEWKDTPPEGEEPYKSVRQDLIPVLVKAIQEQQTIINDLKARITALEGVA